MSQPRLIVVNVTGVVVAPKAQTDAAVNQLQALIEIHSLDWMRYSAGSYVIWTQHELAFWTRVIRSISQLEMSYLFICGVDPNSPIEGWLPQFAWEWISKHRNILPSPTLASLPSLPVHLGGTPRIGEDRDS